MQNFTPLNLLENTCLLDAPVFEQNFYLQKDSTLVYIKKLGFVPKMDTITWTKKNNFKLHLHQGTITMKLFKYFLIVSLFTSCIAVKDGAKVLLFKK
ncbi:hypothetical protein JCM21142_104269 [Saccharicrinis fermentans DSM 9555 = JCM 21142]|uniref:Uncharacterized protein n=1 Tax=Saccharicrinis fermentans DSM 9555 = JCM 21142 TaxID=869213 RepID=W7Y3T8_9BACT|nr:hypothetical protein JCM21142_104269 [Saccharicrinis fermentans DSM 9555 = JCM 21142]